MPAADPPPLLIFDCDGVLVDSEPIAERCMAAALAELGLSLGLDELRRRFQGRRLDDCLAELDSEVAGGLPRDFARVLQERTYSALAAGLQPVPGVRAALQVLVGQQGLQVCVASSGEPAKIRLSLATTGLQTFFGDRLFSATAVARGKPAPDVFELAAATLGAAPEHCCVVEDSLPGMLAGLAAGMRVIGYVGATAGFSVPDGVEVLHRMSALPALFVPR